MITKTHPTIHKMLQKSFPNKIQRFTATANTMTDLISHHRTKDSYLPVLGSIIGPVTTALRPLHTHSLHYITTMFLCESRLTIKTVV